MASDQWPVISGQNEQEIWGGRRRKYELCSTWNICLYNNVRMMNIVDTTETSLCHRYLEDANRQAQRVVQTVSIIEP